MPKIRGIDYQQLEDALNKVGINTDTNEAALTVVPPAARELNLFPQNIATYLKDKIKHKHVGGFTFSLVQGDNL